MFQHWDLSSATVVDRQENGSNAHPTNPHYKYVVELASPEGETFRAEMKDPVGGRPFKVRAPGVGEQITVKVRWKDREVKFNTDDPALGYDPLAGAKAKKAEWKESLAATPGTEPARPPSRISISPDANVTINGKRIGAPAGPASLAGQLAKLSDLHDRGVLSDAQFEAAKNSALSEGA